MDFKNWQEWHNFMKDPSAFCTIRDKSFLIEGGCPRCGHKNWMIISDGWAYCKKCGYNQSQDFEISRHSYIYVLTEKGDELVK